jgi:hypothetical protein
MRLSVIEKANVMRQTVKGTTAGFAAALLVAACGGGGGDGGSGMAGPPPASPAVSAYQSSLLLGGVDPVSLSIVPATTTDNPILISPVAAPLLTAGNNALVSLHLSSTTSGSGIACVSAAANSVGTVTGANVGVNIKSVAALLDNTWTVSATPSADWAALGASAAIFDGWENCGAKAEGAPSPSSTLIVSADGSFSDNVFDGNPSTTVTTVNQSFTASQAASLLSANGYLDTSQPASAQIIRLKLYHNAARQTVLVEQGIPVTGATNQTPGFIAIYFPR